MTPAKVETIYSKSNASVDAEMVAIMISELNAIMISELNA
jgi:hypothetical protein